MRSLRELCTSCLRYEFGTATARLRLVKAELILLTGATMLLLFGCDGDYLHMREQLRVDPLEPSAFYADNLSARPIPEHTVPRGEWGRYMLNEALFTGQLTGEFIQEFPIEVSAEVMVEGRDLYDVFCSPCHGYTGYGNGMIVQRGLKPPPSFHSERLLNEPIGYYYDVITNGFGAMYSYDSRLDPVERWAVVAYVRALQLSQDADVELLSTAEREFFADLTEE